MTCCCNAWQGEGWAVGGAGLAVHPGISQRRAAPEGGARRQARPRAAWYPHTLHCIHVHASATGRSHATDHQCLWALWHAPIQSKVCDCGASWHAYKQATLPVRQKRCACGPAGLHMGGGDAKAKPAEGASSGLVTVEQVGSALTSCQEADSMLFGDISKPAPAYKVPCMACGQSARA